MSEEELTSQEFWGTFKASEWARMRESYSKIEAKQPDQESLSQMFIPKEFEKIADGIESILEVGAGDGRLIGGFADKYRDKKCCSVDINPDFSKYVAQKHGIKTFVGDVTKKLPFKDNQFDFIYTFQVLQHVRSKEDIMTAINEMKRVAKKEVWLSEGWGDLERWRCKNGHQRHSVGGGTFYWNIPTRKRINNLLCRSR